MKRILVTGATGQIGSELTGALREKYGPRNIVAAGHKTKPEREFLMAGPFVSLDVRDAGSVEKVVKEHRIDTIFHLAALLSAAASKSPQLAWDVNVNGLRTVLEAARLHHCALFFPSSIGVFGPSTPRTNTPQETLQRPTSIYGVTKVTGELLCDYYHRNFGLDTRGLRYPGLISYATFPGGGTTDYAVEIFYAAIREKRYCCFLKEDTRLDMMFMPDAIRAALELMAADPDRLKHRNAFNVTAMSITPRELAEEIRKHLPDFRMEYRIDPLRQAIADSWPENMDDSAARTEWGWKPKFGLASMTKEMLEHLAARFYKEEEPKTTFM
jgi:nucleoside-diphosphate-sugar epimerase